MRQDAFLKAWKRDPVVIAHVKPIALDREAIRDMQACGRLGIAPARVFNVRLQNTPVPKLNRQFNQNLGKLAKLMLGPGFRQTERREYLGGPVIESAACFEEHEGELLLKRKNPRAGGDEFPIRTNGLYQLVAPHLTIAERTKVENATFVADIEDAFELLKSGYHIRMGRKGVRPSFICLESIERIDLEALRGEFFNA